MATGSRVFFDMMYQPPFKVLVLGDLCSRVTVPVAESAAWWNITQVRRRLYAIAVVTGHLPPPLPGTCSAENNRYGRLPPGWRWGGSVAEWLACWTQAQ